MLKIKEENLKRVLSLLLSLVIFGCDGEYSLSSEATEYKVTVDVRLPVDTNGYYHLTLDRDKWQTLHRVSGTVSSDGYAVEYFWVEWESNLYWYLDRYLQLLSPSLAWSYYPYPLLQDQLFFPPYLYHAVCKV